MIRERLKRTVPKVLTKLCKSAPEVPSQSMSMVVQGLCPDRVVSIGVDGFLPHYTDSHAFDGVGWRAPVRRSFVNRREPRVTDDAEALRSGVQQIGGWAPGEDVSGPVC
jgi:hypothetical protein